MLKNIFLILIGAIFKVFKGSRIVLCVSWMKALRHCPGKWLAIQKFVSWINAFNMQDVNIHSDSVFF